MFPRNLPGFLIRASPLPVAGRDTISRAVEIVRGGFLFRANVVMLSNPGNFCQNRRFFVGYRVRASGWQGGNRTRSVKKRAWELSVWRISPPRRPFSCGKNGISLLKEISFLPQRREFLAAKQFPGVWKAGKNGASDGFFLLVGGRQRAKSVCLFASLPPRPADAGAAPVRTASRGGRQSVAENRLPAFILPSSKPARFANFHPPPTLRPSARFSRCRF